MNNLKIAQNKMTHMLNTFHNICCKLNIKYWCLGGTLIGAVRHSGFIPWDGDVDVAMILDDYIILEKYIQEELPSTMYFFGKSLPGLSKIKDLYSSYIGADQKKNNKHHGLQIDIFIYNVIESNGNKKIKSIEKFLDIYKEDLYNYNDIFPVKLAKFENFYVFIPNKIEKICKYSYGGYPPPFPEKNKQICHEGLIDPTNSNPFYKTLLFKDIYLKKTQQWFSESANKELVPLHHMAGWNYINQEEWNNLCKYSLQGIDLEKTENFFDAGCGVGALFNYINNINNKINLYGCDINKNVINKCKNLFPQSNVTINDIRNLNNYESEKFDNVICISTISYLQSLTDVKLAVDELLRITKSNGNVNICIMSNNIKGLKSFNILIPKNFWRKEKFNVSEIKILDMPFPKFTNRYSVFIKKL